MKFKIQTIESQLSNSDLDKNRPFTSNGITLLPNTGEINSDNKHSFGDFYVLTNGLLISTHSEGEWTAFVDGVFLDQNLQIKGEAIAALSIFIEKGLNALQDLNGFFNILIIKQDGSEFHFISDLLCSRSWYLYSTPTSLALASSPIIFSSANLPMSLNRLALFEQIRLLHTSHKRTIVNEVSRILPSYSYTYSKSGLKKHNLKTFCQKVDNSITLEESSEKVKQLCSEVIKGITTHPKLKYFPTHLPLTGGLDSRHLLAELLEQHKTPELIHHVLIQQKDYVPVQTMCTALNLKQHVQTLEDIDTNKLLMRWMDKTGGLSNVHQYYLLSLATTTSEKSALSFNGYLMDLLMGMAVKTDQLDTVSPHKPVWNRTYSSRSIRKLLMPDSNKLEKEVEALFIEELESYSGEPWFKMLMMDIHHRGLHYTGNIDTMLQEEVYSFSPAVSLNTYKYAASTPHSVAGDKKARLNSLNTYFPEISKFPGVEGVSFSEMTDRPEIIEHPFKKNLKLLVKTLKSGFSKNHVSESEHSWIRNHPDLHKIHKKLVDDSLLVADGHLKKIGLKMMWKLNEMGGYQGWALMSVFSAEVAYRLLVKNQTSQQVSDWLFSD